MFMRQFSPMLLSTLSLLSQSWTSLTLSWSVEELDKAVEALSNGKAPGSDGIPPEVITSGKPVPLALLHEVLCLCWKGGAVPGGGGTPIHYLYGYVPPKGVVILKLLI